MVLVLALEKQTKKDQANSSVSEKAYAYNWNAIVSPTDAFTL